MKNDVIPWLFSCFVCHCVNNVFKFQCCLKAFLVIRLLCDVDISSNDCFTAFELIIGVTSSSLSFWSSLFFFYLFNYVLNRHICSYDNILVNSNNSFWGGFRSTSNWSAVTIVVNWTKIFLVSYSRSGSYSWLGIGLLVSSTANPACWKHFMMVSVFTSGHGEAHEKGIQDG